LGLFNFFKNKIGKSNKITYISLENDITSNTNNYFQQDTYFYENTFEDVPIEQRFISFEERKKTAIPSENGLYVPEILMLHLCKKYPKSKFRYPCYWWYKYGIRDVGLAYESLVERGFIKLNKQTEKYELTDLGKTELKANEYVPYMHKHSKYTTFTIWDLNQILGMENKNNYKEIIQKKHIEIENSSIKANEKLVEIVRINDPKRYKVLKSQEIQLRAFLDADAKYIFDKDINWIINFWEKVWQMGGPKFEDSKWIFRLPDLYLKAQRYDDAITLVKRIKKERAMNHHDKANLYISKIKDEKAKNL